MKTRRFKKGDRVSAYATKYRTRHTGTVDHYDSDGHVYVIFDEPVRGHWTDSGKEEMLNEAYCIEDQLDFLTGQDPAWKEIWDDSANE